MRKTSLATNVALPCQSLSAGYEPNEEEVDGGVSVLFTGNER